MQPIVHEQGDRFDDRNLFLQATLGLVALATRFRQLAIRHGNVPLAPSPRPSAGRDEPVLDLLLGIAAATERALTILERVREQGDEHALQPARPVTGPETDGVERAVRVRGLLG